MVKTDSSDHSRFFGTFFEFLLLAVLDDRFNSCQVIYSQFGLAIHQNYHQARRRFVESAQNEIAIVPDFHKRILFSDEAHFWLNGYVNKQNCRIWSEANSQVYVETPLHPEKLTVWCALWAGGIIGPYFFKNDEGHNVTVNGDRYRAMITNFFIPELNNHDVQELWFQQDGATCHTARATIDLLKDTFGDRLISRFGPVNWPPRSCDLTPLDYFLWGYEEVFLEVLSPNTWKSVFNNKNDERLRKLLPVFPENDEKEKNITLRKLMLGENFKFGSPFKHFFRKLKDGFLCSDVVEVTKALKRANYREYKNHQKQYSFRLLQEILLSRKKLINASYTSPPDQPVKMQQFIAKPKDATLSERTRLRYFSALQDLREEVGEIDTSSDDENYPESSPPKVSRKFKKQLQNHEASLSSEMTRITATTTFPPGFLGSGHFLNHCFDMFEVSEERYREMLLTHKERLVLSPNHPKLITSHIDLKSVSSRCNFSKRPVNKTADNAVKKRVKVSESSEKPVNSVVNRESLLIGPPSPFSNLIIKDDLLVDTSIPDNILEIVAPSVQESEVQTDPLSIRNDLENTRLFDHSHTIRLPSPCPQIVHQYPTSFFAVLRDLFCESAEQKLSASKLEEKVKNWQGSASVTLFEWMSYQECWSDLVSSALKFLAGDFIKALREGENMPLQTLVFYSLALEPSRVL
ncbi:nuclear factor related to kappa-B-binding protein [Trichonephila clavipes]|nr:nuclear factor related to kappa-B-binding protein [Trichonephila clavipes]